MILFCNGKKGFCYEADCSGEKCPHYNGTGGYYVKTNGEQIRAMTDEELAELLLDGCIGSDCNEQPQNEHGSVNCYECRLKWLRQPVEEKKPATGYDDKEVSGLLDD